MSSPSSTARSTRPRTTTVPPARRSPSERSMTTVQFKRQRELKRTKIEIIPMIDTMFFLLVFFMLSSLAMIKFNALPVNLPRASTAPHQKAADLTVTIDKNRHFFVNKDPVSPDQLGAKLLERAGG